MQRSTSAEYKPCSKSSQEMGTKLDRLSGSSEFTAGQPSRSQHSYSVRLEDWPRLPFNGELPHTVRALLRRGERKIVVDLAGVSRIDAAGIGELVRAYNIALASSGAFRIVNTDPRVREMLERVGLLDCLHTGFDETQDSGRAE